jgi:hypothetical protein
MREGLPECRPEVDTRMTDPHPTEAPTTPGDGDHGDHVDDHAHGSGDEPLGLVDVAAWGAGVVGIAISILIAACFALATSGIG